MVMKTSLKTLILVLLTVMSFSAAQAAFECDDRSPIELEGKVCEVQKDSKPYQIWIDDATDSNGSFFCRESREDWTEIFGVPFLDLERELSEELEKEVTIDEGNCVTIKYYETLYGLDKFCSLLEYCDDCDASDDGCYGDDMGERPFHKRKPPHHPHPGKNSPWNQEDPQP